jgi:hypothetical protein
MGPDAALMKDLHVTIRDNEMIESAKDAAIPSSAPLRANAYPKDGFSMVVDGKFKQHFVTRDDAHQAAVSLKTKFPLLQVAVRDSVTAERTPVNLPE